MLGVSVDSRAANAKFAREVGATFPVLSDTTKSVARAYGVLNPLFRWADRATFTIDKQGVIRRIDTGGGAVDPGGALQACRLLKTEAAR